MPETALFYQPDCGLSGDMHLAALLDLGVPQDWLRAELQKLPVSGDYDLQVTADQKMGISGTRANVNARDSHDHRHHSTIVKMINDAGYSAGVTRRALAIFEAIAIAEGKIHDIPPDKVHFHEVGAVDSIIDIVAAALCIEYLAPDHILCSAIEVGQGYVDCAHGRFPVPAPATQELLSGAPCRYGGVDGEATTPTGAAILSANVSEFLPDGTFTPEKFGYGIGHKDFSKPNVLRVALGTYKKANADASKRLTQYKVEANIDDMSPEAYDPLSASLFAAGAIDVYLTPIMMKKNRPAQCLTALCGEAYIDAITDIMLNQSTTIGLRILPFTKLELPRERVAVETSLGHVQVKLVRQPDGASRWKVEHNDIVKAAEANNTPYPQAKAEIEAEVSRYITEEYEPGI